jgi:hypothetical protein
MVVPGMGATYGQKAHVVNSDERSHISIIYDFSRGATSQTNPCILHLKF